MQVVCHTNYSDVNLSTTTQKLTKLL